MSLKIWLPLNGNIENKGLADVTITNNGATIDTLKWHHLVAVYNNNAVSLYWNGELQGTTNSTCGEWGEIPIYVGTRFDTTSNHINGNISDVRVYSTVLDATAVAELYKLGQ